MEYIEKTEEAVQFLIESQTYGTHTVTLDISDYERSLNYTWSIHYTPTNLYAVSWIDGKFTLLHRFVLQYAGELDIDHVNNNGLDCRRSNLRIVSRTINNLNRRDPGTGIKRRVLSNGKEVFDARIQLNGISIHLGTYSSYRRAEIVVQYNRNRVLNGEETVIAIKRENRWSTLKKYKMPIN